MEEGKTRGHGPAVLWGGLHVSHSCWVPGEGRPPLSSTLLISTPSDTGWESGHHPKSNAAPSLPGSETSSKNSVWKSHAEAPEEDRHRQSSGPGGHHHTGGPHCHHGDTERLPGVQRQVGGRPVTMALPRPRARPRNYAPRTQLPSRLVPRRPSGTHTALHTKPQVPAFPLRGDP